MKFLTVIAALVILALAVVLAGYIASRLIRCSATGCKAKPTKFPHGIPCCDEHACEVDCSAWLGYDCDCIKSKTEREKQL